MHAAELPLAENPLQATGRAPGGVLRAALQHNLPLDGRIAHPTRGLPWLGASFEESFVSISGRTSPRRRAEARGDGIMIFQACRLPIAKQPRRTPAALRALLLLCIASVEAVKFGTGKGRAIRIDIAGACAAVSTEFCCASLAPHAELDKKQTGIDTMNFLKNFKPYGNARP